MWLSILYAGVGERFANGGADFDANAPQEKFRLGGLRSAVTGWS